jgi:signal transduction histidine kinase
MTLEISTKKLMADITLSIHQSLNLDDIFNETITKVRQGLNLDRVLLYRFEPDWSGIIVAESVVFPWKAIFGEQIKDPCLTNDLLEQYLQGRVQVVEDVYTAQLHSCHLDVLAAYQVRANLVLGIVTENKLWGLLIAHNCRSSRRWKVAEIEMLNEIKSHLGVAIHQAQLHEKMTCFNNYLGAKIKERTAKLKQTIEFEQLIRNLTEKVRDSLDESIILSTLTEELAQLLKINHCKIDLYNPSQQSTTIVYEYTHNAPICKDITVELKSLPNFYQQLLQKQTLQIIPLIPIFSSVYLRLNQLICPIFDDQGVLGNLWLIRSSEQIFNELEIEFVQQLATQCAIAIRQARLYQSSQLHIKELEKLNQLKDDFLKTISHELKTPMSSIIIGVQTLQKILNDHDKFFNKQEVFQRVFKIIYQSSQQQKQLVDDLLSLCYLDAKQEIIECKSINLKQFINLIIQPFEQHTKNHQQELITQILLEGEVIESDPKILQRILTELLNNACKYTPSQEIITLSISQQQEPTSILFQVTNSGVEIAEEEISKIFDKLYRIPNHDPWRYGGVGLGLTLVKKLVELLQGEITVQSQNKLTQFIVTIPINK